MLPELPAWAGLLTPCVSLARILTPVGVESAPLVALMGVLAPLADTLEDALGRLPRPDDAAELMLLDEVVPLSAGRKEGTETDEAIDESGPDGVERPEVSGEGEGDEGLMADGATLTLTDGEARPAANSPDMLRDASVGRRTVGGLSLRLSEAGIATL